MKWDVGVGDGNALKFIQAKLREAMEVARTTRCREAIYFTEIGYLAINELLREDQAQRSSAVAVSSARQRQLAAGDGQGSNSQPEPSSNPSERLSLLQNES